MTKPQNFDENSDYATLKNDAKGQLVVNINTGMVIPAGASYTWSGLANIGTKNAPIRALGQTTKYAGTFIGTTLLTDITVLINFPPPTNVPQTLYVNVERISDTTLRAYAVVTNYSPDPMTVTGGAQTVTFDVNTFLSPFIN